MDIPSGSSVVIAMSGGVDSSVAAALLKEQGYRVTGMMLRLWSEPGTEESNRCCTPDAMAQARRVAAQLGIPFYAIDAQQPFYTQVVEYFLDSYSAGATPNPCMLCNRTIRWGVLLEHARLFGADYLATGHYAQIRRQPDGSVQLLHGVDANKDQSYVLSGLNQEQLQHTLWPLGGMTKPQVREKARQLGLVVAERPESQDLCFLGSRSYREFLQAHRPETAQPGQIVNQAGEVLGQHEGLSYYTIGQRKGLRIASSQPLYVIKKDFSRNELIVGFEDELGQKECFAGPMNWIAGAPPSAQFEAQVKIRYKAQPVNAHITAADPQNIKIEFEYPLRDLTPGQFAVVYAGDIALGSGMIHLNPLGEKA